MMTRLDANVGIQAAEYVSNDLVLCPIPHGEKGPKAKGWNLIENAITDPTVAATLTGNIGLLHAFSGTMALDIDNGSAASEYLLARGVNLAQLFAAPDRVEVASGRAGRGKLLFRLPTNLSERPLTLQVKGDDGGIIVEFRCADAGGNSVQDVLPPSVHPDTGKPYQWVGDWRRLPTIPALLLGVWHNELAKKFKAGGITPPSSPVALPPGFAPQSFTPNPGFTSLEESLPGMTVLETVLDYVSSDVAYDGWRNRVWAIMSTGWKCAPQIAHSWSQRAPHRYDPVAVEALVRTFDPVKGITPATLFHLAKQSGWTMPQLAALPSTPQPPAIPAAVPYKSVDWSSHGDIRNARHFATMFNGKLIYVHGLGNWLRWSIDRWVMCDQGQEVEAAKHAAQMMLADAAAMLSVDQDKGKRRVGEAVSAHNLARLKATLELARSEPGMSIGHAGLDADPVLLGVGDGIVDLRYAALMPNRPELMITRHCAANYMAVAPCPRWLQFMAEVFAGDQATIDAVQRLLGYTLTGMNTEEVIVFCIGFGANGKSIFGNVVSRIMADYAKGAPHSLLAARRGDDHGARGDIAMLMGARLVSVNELPGGMQLDEQVVKALAGRESITARHLYGSFFTFTPCFTVWVRTNHRPIIKGDDDGIWRRIIILPFQQKFEGARRDPHLEAKLWAERDGILAWMIEGARRYLTGGLALSPMMAAEQRQYRSESDLLGEFLGDCTVAVAAGSAPDKDLFSRWSVWCDSNGHKAGSKATFTQRLAERGFPIRKSNGQRFYSGLKAVP